MTMAEKRETIDELTRNLLPLGLRIRGGFRLDPESDGALLRLFPEAFYLALVGNVGNEIWVRSRDAILATGGNNPLNDWIAASLSPLAQRWGAALAFDFDGPPFFPFQEWAQRAESVYPSPLGLLIHPEYGLWHAYRAAFLFPYELDMPAGRRSDLSSPCDKCREKPCLKACPVSAFAAMPPPQEEKGDRVLYDVGKCASHLLSGEVDCRSSGCLARLACPVGKSERYEGDHAAFYMRAFVRSLKLKKRID